MNKIYKVYRNLNNGKLSIKNTKGLVIGHCDSITLTSVEFKVNRKGVERIRKNKKKEVVATVNGNILNAEGFVPFKGRDFDGLSAYDYFLKSQLVKYAFKEEYYKMPDRVYFNPYEHDTFYTVESNGDFTYKSDVYGAFAVAIECDGLMLGFGLQLQKPDEIDNYKGYNRRKSEWQAARGDF
jgi:hypothetical protein